MKQQRYTIPPQQLLGQVVRATGNEELLQQLRDRSDEVLAALEIDDSRLVAEGEPLELDPNWLGAVYEALSGGQRLTPEEEAAAKALFHANITEERSVGRAFRDSLWAGLPPDLQDLETWFADTPRVDSKQMEELMREPSIEGGMPTTAIFALYGFTPLTLYYATEAISSALDRLQHYKKIEPGSPVWLNPRAIRTSHSEDTAVKPDSLIAEIRMATQSEEATARSLYGWLLKVAEYKPALFEGFRAAPEEDGVRLYRAIDTSDNLLERWRSPRAAVVCA